MKPPVHGLPRAHVGDNEPYERVGGGTVVMASVEEAPIAGPPQRGAMKREAVKRASTAEVVSGVAACGTSMCYAYGQHGATRDGRKDGIM